MLRQFVSLLFAVSVVAAPPAQADGVQIDEASRLRKLVPAEQLEQSATLQYHDLMRQAAAKNALAPEGAPALRRLRGIAQRIIPHSTRFNPRAQQWRWEVNLIVSKDANAFCMPGGKIAFFTGLIDGLKLSDEEIAIVMGHEIAHALREHARERIAKSQLTQIGVGLLGQLVGGGRYSEVFHAGGNLLTLKFSREDESDADVVGLDLAARAGFNPQAGITLWQKMEKAGGAGGFAWLSTHPAGKDRIREIERHLPEVMPLYERARNTSKTKG